MDLDKYKKYELNNRNDLFKGRREEIKKTLPLLKSNKEINSKGFIIGLSIISIPIFISIGLILQSFSYRQSRSNLQKFVEEYDESLMLINKIDIQNKIIEESINKLSEAILSIRSGSVILSEISKTIPKKITLSQIEVKDDDLYIKGQVFDKNGLETINALILQLKNSSFILEDSIKLIKAESLENESKESGEKNLKGLTFFISCELENNLKKINKEYIKNLGSSGLAKRISILDSRGLIK